MQQPSRPSRCAACTPCSHLRVPTKQLQLATFSLEQQAGPKVVAPLPAHAHMCGGLLMGLLVVLQKGGVASTVISFAQKTYANGVLTSKLHVIELGAQAGTCKELCPDSHVLCHSCLRLR